MKCFDCGDAKYTTKPGSRDDICVTCWDVRIACVDAMLEGRITRKQFLDCQRGQYTGRRNMQALLDDVADVNAT